MGQCERIHNQSLATIRNRGDTHTHKHADGHFIGRGCGCWAGMFECRARPGAYSPPLQEGRHIVAPTPCNSIGGESLGKVR